MEYQKIIDKIKPELDKAVNFLEREISKVRPSGISIDLIEDIEVDCFGQKMALKQLAAISFSESRQIIIQTWDDSYMESVQRAIEKANIGIKPIVDKKIIRLSLPSLSEEYRQELIKMISDKKEGARKTVRHLRDETWKEIQISEREGKISEDDKYKAKDKLEDLISKTNEKIENISEKKKKEIIL